MKKRNPNKARPSDLASKAGRAGRLKSPWSRGPNVKKEQNHRRVREWREVD